ncbi:MAG: flagellar basal body protein [Gaiellales bacterium]
MGIFNGINMAESAMSIHRLRSEIAAENVANIHTPGYKRQEVDLRASNFSTALTTAKGGYGATGPASVGGLDAHDGAVQVAGIRRVSGGPYDERQNALLATTDMMRAKSAFELNVKAATLLKSMALSSLEIGRGS